MLNRRNQVLFVLFLIMIILTFIRNWLIIESQTWSIEYITLEQELKEEDRIKYILNEELLSISSLQYLEPEARKRGFVDTSYIYIK